MLNPRSFARLAKTCFCTAGGASLLRRVGIPLGVLLSSTVLANSPPVAFDQSKQMPMGSAVTVWLEGRDDDGPGPYTVTIVNGPQHGTLTQHDLLAYRYQPKAGYSGLDGFTWTVHDGTEASNVATVTLTVNAAPVVQNQSIVSAAGEPTPVTLAYTDDGVPGPYSFKIERAPRNGFVDQVEEGTYLYTPSPGFSGVDSFQWSVSDGMKKSLWAKVEVLVNRPPVAFPRHITSRGPDGVAFMLGYEDDGQGSGAEPTVVLVEPPLHGAARVEALPGRIRYIPNPGFSGNDTFSVAISDGLALSEPAVIGVQQLPSTSPDLELGLSYPLAGPLLGDGLDAFNAGNMNTLGLRLFRFGGGSWVQSEKKPGNYDWVVLDTRLDWASEYGFSAFVTIDASAPGWACDRSKRNADSCVPVDMADFGRFVEALMARLADYAAAPAGLPVHSIAFGNEWSKQARQGGYPGTKEDYVAQANIVYDAVKRRFPDIPVVLGGLGYADLEAYSFCKGFMYEYGTANRESYCGGDDVVDMIAKIEYVLDHARYDKIDVHLYYHEHLWEDMLAALVSEGLPDGKKGVEIVATEFGGPHAYEEARAADEEYQAERVASYLDAIADLDLSEGYFWSDLDSGWFSLSAFKYSGLMSMDRLIASIGGADDPIEKPAYWVYRDFAASLRHE